MGLSWSRRNSDQMPDDMIIENFRNRLIQMEESWSKEADRKLISSQWMGDIDYKTDSFKFSFTSPGTLGAPGLRQCVVRASDGKFQVDIVPIVSKDPRKEEYIAFATQSEALDFIRNHLI